MTSPVDLGFDYRYIPGARTAPSDDVTLLLLHGTGGDGDSLLQLGATLLPGATLLSPTGNVLEHGAPRFFRRFAEGVFDQADLMRRTDELVSFIGAAAVTYHLDPQRVVAIGYSNGANIAASVLLRHAGVLAGAVLFRAMPPFVPETLPTLRGTPASCSVQVISTHSSRVNRQTASRSCCARLGPTSRCITNRRGMS